MGRAAPTRRTSQRLGDHSTAVLLAGGIGQRNLGAQIHLRPEALAAAAQCTRTSPTPRQLQATGATKTQDELIALALDAATRARGASLST